MIRVAFVIEGQTFLGSANYFRNLFSALALLPRVRLKLMLFVATQAPPQLLDTFRHIDIVPTKLLDERTLAARVRRRLNRVSAERDVLLGLLLARHRVDVLSHFGPLLGAGVRTIGWIPDFQHVHLPAFFSDRERALRDAAFRSLARDCDRVLLSSETAQRDLATFAPAALGKSRVLRFVPEVDAPQLAPIATLEERYGFKSPYFYVPNQFWIHKNHRLIVDALASLKAKGVTPTVLMSGSTEDYRHPTHYADLMARVDQHGLRDSFKVLGLIPYVDLISLIHHCVAVINPSLFEGWSSSVEEAKALDKTVLLSNLPVHIEQNPARGVFFDPRDADDLAAKIRLTLKNEASRAPARSDIVYSDSYKADRLQFAVRYEDLVLELVGSAA